MHDHSQYISRCITLAKFAGKHTKTNPMVGAVLVSNDRIIGEGYHQKYGEAHAEVNCINSVIEEDKNLISQSTLYVSLEPCCIERKTPACTNLIIKNKIPHVVVGCLDPNPDVNGLGVKLLEQHEIKVEVLNDEKCENLISKFKANLNKRPYIILKWAQSFDGFIGHKEKQIWLSNKYSKVYSHKLRTEVDGILIGKNTAIIDNPKLTAREYLGENPMRILLDEKLEVDSSTYLLSDVHPTIIINSIKDELIENKKYIKVNDTRDINEVLKVLYDNRIYSLIVEGGKTILDWFINGEMWDEAYVIKTKKKLLDEYTENELIKAPSVSGKLLDKVYFDDDEILQIKNIKK